MDGKFGGYDDEDVFDPADPSVEEPACRVCGCTDLNCDSCVARTGRPCHWVESDLCSACRFDLMLEVVRYAMALPQQERVELPTEFVVEMIARYDHFAAAKLPGASRLRPTVHAFIKIDEQGCHWIDGQFGKVRRRIRCGSLEEAQARLAALR